jgi:hypothetical protein
MVGTPAVVDGGMNQRTDNEWQGVRDADLTNWMSSPSFRTGGDGWPVAHAATPGFEARQL